MENNTPHIGEEAHTILQNKDVVTRFPPSPTGQFHVGSARTALFNYLFTKKHDGEMVMRFEDTDEERSKKEHEEDILSGLEWLGIEYFGSLFRQSERTAVYQNYLEKLLDDDKAYISDDEEGERDSVIRFRNPHTTIEFHDMIRGDIEFDTSDLGDFVIAKSKEDPLYHLAVVIDDYEMSVSHVIRGDDHISNTPRQILIQEALDIPQPQYAHIPLIHGPDNSKLSKRHGATSVNAFKNQGYLPEAFVNYIALLGWNPGNDRELFDREDLIESFSLEDVQKSPAVFDKTKLDWFNREHIKRLDDHDLLHGVRSWIPEDIRKLPDYSEESLKDLLPIFRDRLETYADVEDMADNGDLEFFFEKPGYYTQDLLWRDLSGEEGLEQTKNHLSYVISSLDELQSQDFDEEAVKDAVWEYASEEGRGEVLWPMRYALSGKDESPGPFEIAAVLGKEETIQRLKEAVSNIEDALSEKQ